MRTSLLATWAAALIGALTLAQPGAAQQPANVWDGVYSAEQAVRGTDVFDQRNSITCHGEDGIPPSTGPYFMTRWDGHTVADVTAYLLKLNELPAGSTALQTDPAATARVRFTGARPAR